MTTSPIVYKKISCQFAFLVHEDGRLQIKMLSTGIEKEKKFKNEEEARKYVASLEEIL